MLCSCCHLTLDFGNFMLFCRLCQTDLLSACHTYSMIINIFSHSTSQIIDFWFFSCLCHCFREKSTFHFGISTSMQICFKPLFLFPNNDRISSDPQELLLHLQDFKVTYVSPDLFPTDNLLLVCYSSLLVKFQ